MAFSVLPSLRPGDWRAVICVRVCRKWEYRGGTDDGPIQHVDLVLLDEQGNSLYAEIPAPEVEAKSPLIEEDGIYVIGRFRVSNAKSGYRAVDAPYMVEFTLHTTVSAARTDLPDFPKYAYRITPIDGLPAHAGDTTNFLDTIGTLVEVSDVQPVHLPNKPPTLSRYIVLRDLSYSEIKITLWGQRATAFNIQGVYNRDEARPIIVLFVGGLMKSYQGNYYLSGNAACRWYFNPTIPEAQPLYESNQNQRLEIRTVASPVQQRVQNRASAQLEEKNLFQMNQINPYDFSEDGYRCTVTIGRLVSGASWWFPSCNKCSKSCVPDGAGYKCIPCCNTSFKYKYKVCFTALDGTDEAEMVCFGDIARRMIVTMTRQSFYKSKKTYSVAALVTAHGHPALAPNNPGHDDVADATQGQPGTPQSGDSSNSSGSQSALQRGTPLTPPSALSSPNLCTTPSSNLPSLQTPVSDKRKRGGRPKGGQTRRKLTMPDDEDTTDAALNAPGSSAAHDAVQASDGGRSSPEDSPTAISG